MIENYYINREKQQNARGEGSATCIRVTLLESKKPNPKDSRITFLGGCSPSEVLAGVLGLPSLSSRFRGLLRPGEIRPTNQIKKPQISLPIIIAIKNKKYPWRMKLPQRFCRTAPHRWEPRGGQVHGNRPCLQRPEGRECPGVFQRWWRPAHCCRAHSQDSDCQNHCGNLHN